MTRKINLALKLREVLRENILQRYDTPEYWNGDIIDIFLEEYGIREKNERGKILLIVEHI